MEEFCISEGWIKVAAGRARDRYGCVCWSRSKAQKPLSGRIRCLIVKTHLQTRRRTQVRRRFRGRAALLCAECRRKGCTEAAGDGYNGKTAYAASAGNAADASKVIIHRNSPA
jgi:hypothetical protein